MIDPRYLPNLANFPPGYPQFEMERRLAPNLAGAFGESAFFTSGATVRGQPVRLQPLGSVKRASPRPDRHAQCGSRRGARRGVRAGNLWPEVRR